MSEETLSSTTVYWTQVTELSLIFPTIFVTTFQNHLFKVEQHFIKNESLTKIKCVKGRRCKRVFLKTITLGNSQDWKKHIYANAFLATFPL